MEVNKEFFLSFGQVLGASKKVADNAEGWSKPHFDQQAVSLIDFQKTWISPTGKFWGTKLPRALQGAWDSA